MENLENTITAISDSIGIVGNGANEILQPPTILPKGRRCKRQTLKKIQPPLVRLQ